MWYVQWSIIQSLKRRNFFFESLRIGKKPVAYACNPSYSGGREQEDHGSKPTWANSLQDPILKITRKDCRVAQGVGPEFKPQYQKKKKISVGKRLKTV
jgi:hypothetical protein